ncbi:MULTISPECIES: RNA polymerase sigma factor [Arenibacter]|uniref:RNA polymerase sigma factor n=1 Tax=Arenibacter TaxID=178469 RepID=UPI001122EF01|nr:MULTISPECIES: sigma-70 family RNA polymerase sigma factor [Arenibacter]
MKKRMLGKSNFSEYLVWERIKTGDTKSLGQLYDYYVDDLYSHGMKRISDKGWVMDCIHDLFLDLYKYRLKLSEPDNISYYLQKSLERKINRKYGRKESPVSVDIPLLDFIRDKNSIPSIESEIIINEQASKKSNRLAVAMDSLTEKQQKGLYLRFYQDKSYEEISKIMNVSIQSARTMIYRALTSLRQTPMSVFLLLEILFFKNS